ncbi:hypothetical protein BB559_006845 [Furculomyces boomerangus]|uniref:RING-type domain-containing protein n=2 Tax=Harpellales TaxID=61421 RepID=A0A2T9Y071_9FUNG|nr:hypothetical protein BB559_006845 [Furculomyces boomerangus]PVZ97995.1 hypothetical protein BB558_006017 [Smittium angustum]
MSRHSKNNTAKGYFTYAERQMLDYGSKNQRIGSDSKRDFDCCYLCLQKARIPVCCLKGHLSCKECIYESILSQKANIIRLEKNYKEYLETLAAGKKDEEKQLQLVNKIQFIERETLGTRSRTDTKQSKPYDRPTQSSDKKLASFWVPSMSTEAEKKVKKPEKELPQCLESTPHPIKIKNLVPVNFSHSKNNEKICPSCTKTFQNGSKIKVMKKCGHCICDSCWQKFVEYEKKCFTCSEAVKGENGAILLQSEGTGYSGGGGITQVSKYDLGFLG